MAAPVLTCYETLAADRGMITFVLVRMLYLLSALKRPGKITNGKAQKAAAVQAVTID